MTCSHNAPSEALCLLCYPDAAANVFESPADFLSTGTTPQPDVQAIHEAVSHFGHSCAQLGRANAIGTYTEALGRRVTEARKSLNEIIDAALAGRSPRD